jgi:predicted amidohydrolase
LVKARAIENMSYVLFCNRDGNDSALEYIPSSVFADFKGNYNFAERFCYDCAGNKTQIINCECSKEKLVEFREKFPVWKDFDKFKIL